MIRRIHQDYLDAGVDVLTTNTFGANRVALDLYPPEAQELILKEYVPLGSILAQFRIVHTCHPSAYLRITPDALIRRELQVREAQTLYGRRNTLKDPQGRVLSEILEILPATGSG